MEKETPHPSLYMQNTNWFGRTTEWTGEENKRFESALATFGEHEPDRWFKVAAMIPGKTVDDVIKKYKELEDDVTDTEAGRFPVDNRDFDAYRKQPLAARSADHEKKKAVPWTEEEHRLFLFGLLKYGKGDWRNISGNFVGSKTPTQVASHAQKYFLRQQLSGVKDKQRPSINDITIVNLTKPACTDGHMPQTPDQSDDFSSLLCTDNIQEVLNDWNNAEDDLLYDSTDGNVFISSPYEIG